MKSVEQLSLLSGPLPFLLGLLAFAALGASVAGAARRNRFRVGVLGVGSLVAVVAAGTAVGIEHRVGSTFPQTFFLWASLPLFAVGAAVFGWSSSTRRRRLVSVAAVVLVAAFGAECVNAHYAYLPTVGDAIGRPVEDQVPTASVLPEKSASGRSVARQDVLPGAPGRGVVLAVDIPGAVSKFHGRSAMVWLPPAYFASPSPSLPVVLLLAGVPGEPADLLRAGHVGRIADAYAAVHAGLAPILVFPDHNGGFFRDSECVDGPRGNVETYLTVDVPRFLAQHFHASVLARGLGIGGFSEGGTCATTLALRHPDRFAAFLDISGDLRPNAAIGPNERLLTINRLYGGDARQWLSHDPISLLQRPLANPPTALFAAGEDDVHGLAVARALDAAAVRAHLPSSLRTYEGGHTFLLAHSAFEGLFPALADAVLQAAAVAHVV